MSPAVLSVPWFLHVLPLCFSVSSVVSFGGRIGEFPVNSLLKVRHTLLF